MVTTNQKFIVDTEREKKNESKHNTKDSHQITREESRRRRKKKNTTKNPKVSRRKEVIEIR